jgi:predicted ATPase
MLIAVSGTQGCGKSTLISELCNRYPSIEMVPSQTSRKVIAKFGITLEQIYNNKDMIASFQVEVLAQKIADDAEYYKSDKLYIIERSYADLLAYTVANLGSVNKYNQFVQDYYDTCMKFQQRYLHNFFIKGEKFQIQNDNVRPVNNQFAKMIELYLHDCVSTTSHTIITSIDQRVDEIYQALLNKGITL